mmetsp:Transcript_6773/g.16305  ORF Transcript_6773/g.16305 Transcript_6773/m.16305 type:complete len:343 (-) Transcript_6773:970-1998(-)
MTGARTGLPVPMGLSATSWQAAAETATRRVGRGRPGAGLGEGMPWAGEAGRGAMPEARGATATLAVGRAAIGAATAKSATAARFRTVEVAPVALLRSNRGPPAARLGASVGGSTAPSRPPRQIEATPWTGRSGGHRTRLLTKAPAARNGIAAMGRWPAYVVSTAGWTNLARTTREPGLVLGRRSQAPGEKRSGGAICGPRANGLGQQQPRRCARQRRLRQRKIRGPSTGGGRTSRPGQSHGLPETALWRGRQPMAGRGPCRLRCLPHRAWRAGRRARTGPRGGASRGSRRCRAGRRRRTTTARTATTRGQRIAAARLTRLRGSCAKRQRPSGSSATSTLRST